MDASDRSAAVAAAERALADYGTEAGRSALIRVRAGGHEWTGGVDPDIVRPAASLLKLAVGLAAEEALRVGRLDSGRGLTAASLGVEPGDRSVLDLLDPEREVSVREALTLMLGASDNACARWLVLELGFDPITRVISDLDCADTTIAPDPTAGVAGSTTCRDALTLLRVANDALRYPLCAFALRHSIRNSRIPLGATRDDVAIAHKTGTLAGLAHDVALLEGAAGVAEVAFLTEQQHDTLVTGYAMGICTREVLQAWGISVRSTVSVLPFHSGC